MSKDVESVKHTKNISKNLGLKFIEHSSSEVVMRAYV
jgi:hypothetical protein